MTSSIARAALAPFTPRAWLATAQLMTGFVLAVITFFVMFFLAGVGAIVLPTVVLVAIPFVALLACADVFSAWQRSRLAAFAGIRIPETQGVLPRSGGGTGASLLTDLLRAARTVSTWRQIGYHLVVGPVITTAGAMAAAAFWSCGLFFTTIAVQRLVLVQSPWSNPGKLSASTVFGLIVLFIAPWVARGAALLDITVATAMLGPSRAEQLTEHVSTLAESRAGVVSAADDERRRLERDLHDGTQQRLVSMAMRLGLARATLENVPADAMAVIERAHDEAKEALRELRDLVQGMHPAILTDRGLDAALSGIAARAPLPVKLTVGMPTGQKLPAATEAVAFFIVSEALANTAKHAGATEATVSVQHDNSRLTVTITDDGRGGANPDHGSGLRGLKQRAASVDGTLHIGSPLGGPTVITAELPAVLSDKEGGAT